MNGWGIKIATPEEAAFVFDHRWDRGEPELDRYQVDRDRWMAACDWMASSAMCFTITRDGAPEAVLAGQDEGDLCHIWFQAVSTQHLPGLTRYMRRMIGALAGVVHAPTAAVTVFCAHPESEKWYRFLGFTEDNSYCGRELDGLRERRFIRAWR